MHRCAECFCSTCCRTSLLLSLFACAPWFILRCRFWKRSARRSASVSRTQCNLLFVSGSGGPSMFNVDCVCAVFAAGAKYTFLPYLVCAGVQGVMPRGAIQEGRLLCARSCREQACKVPLLQRVVMMEQARCMVGSPMFDQCLLICSILHVGQVAAMLPFGHRSAYVLLRLTCC